MTRRQFRALVAAVALWTVAPASAGAQEYPFTLVVQDGLTALHNRSFADDHGTVYHGTGGHPVFLVYNGA